MTCTHCNGGNVITHVLPDYLLFTAKAKPVITKPLPFITKTNLYDDHWAAKQERGVCMCVCVCLFVYIRSESTFSFPGFTKWLNFILAPTDPFGNIITPQGKPGEYRLL